MKCYFCGSNEIKTITKNTYVNKKGKSVVKCKECEASYDWPLYTEKELEKFYKNLDFDHIIKSGGIVKSIISKLSKLHSNIRAKDRRNYIRELVKHGEIKKGSVLEVGPAKGELLNYLKKDGWEVRGLELSEYFMSYAKRNYNIDLVNDYKKLKGKFDVILMFHVLEHMANPIKELKKLRKILKPNGKIIIEVPNVPNNPVKSLSKEDLESEFSSIHVFHFRTKTFKIVADKVNMRLDKIHRLEHKNIFEGNIYELHPAKNKNLSPVKFIKLASNGAYVVLLHLLNKEIYKEIDSWKKVDYTGYTDVIRAVLGS